VGSPVVRSWYGHRLQRLKELLDSTRKAAIARALIECGHLREQTARELGIGLRTLHYWLKTYGWKSHKDVEKFLRTID